MPPKLFLPEPAGRVASCRRAQAPVVDRASRPHRAFRVTALAAVALCFGLASVEPAFGGWQTFNTSNGLAANGVNTILEDRSGNLWFGTYGGGVSRYDGATWRTFNTADGLASNDVLGMVEDHAGNLWASSGSSGVLDVAPTGRGVSRYDGTSWRTFTTADGLVDDRVTALLVDHAGNVWLGTYGGVSRYDGSTWSKFTTADGLAAGVVTDVLEDHLVALDHLGPLVRGQAGEELLVGLEVLVAFGRTGRPGGRGCGRRRGGRGRGRSGGRGRLGRLGLLLLARGQGQEHEQHGELGLHGAE